MAAPAAVPLSPPPGPQDHPIHPQQVWTLLTPHQQHDVLQRMIIICQHLLTAVPSHPGEVGDANE